MQQRETAQLRLQVPLQALEPHELQPGQRVQGQRVQGQHVREQRVMQQRERARQRVQREAHVQEQGHALPSQQQLLQPCAPQQ